MKKPVAYYCIIYAYLNVPFMRQIKELFRPRHERIVVLFIDIINATTKEEALASAISQFWEGVPKTWYPTYRLKNCLPDGLYPDCCPIYKHDLQENWRNVCASMKSLHYLQILNDTLTNIDNLKGQGGKTTNQ